MVSKPTTPSKVEYTQRIPKELQEINEWYLFDFDKENAGAPRNRNGYRAAWSDEDAGMEFETAVNFACSETTEFDAIGFNFSDAPDYVFIDFDTTFENAFEIDSEKEWSPDVYKFANQTYTEWSKSGTGAHAILKGELPDWWDDAQKAEEHTGVEVFSNSICIFTGWQIGDTSIIKDGDDISDGTFEELLYRIYKVVMNEEPPAFQKDQNKATETEANISDDVYNALDQIDPRKLNCLFSDFTEERDNGFEVWNPGYRGSDSGKSLVRNPDSGVWYDFSDTDGSDEGKLFGILQLFACERNRISKPYHDLSGEDWVNTYKNFRSKVTAYDLPKLDDNKNDEQDIEDIDIGSESWDMLRDKYGNNKISIGACNMLAMDKLRDEGEWRTIADTDALYYYKDGVFCDNGKTKLREELTQGLMDQFKPRRKSTIETLLRGHTTIPREDLGAPSNKVVLQNGVLDLNSRDLDDWSPEYNALHKLDVNYDPDADDPETFLNYLDDVCTTEEDKQKLQEFAGYTLLHDKIPFHKALFLVGATNSGKSTFINILQMMFDDDAISSVGAQEISDERFASAELFGKWLNMRNEISSATVKNVSTMKEVISGDEIKAEKKNQDPFKFKPTAKHIFAGNQLPEPKVDDSAFFERTMLVIMPRTIPREEQDKQLLDKIADEKAGVLNWMLDGLDRLLDQGEFTGDRSPEETEEQWQQWASSVKRFKHECIESTGNHDEDIWSKEHIMSIFEEYTERRGMPSANKQTVTKTLTKDRQIRHTQVGGVDGTGEFTGVQLTEKGRKLLGYLAGDKNEQEVEEVLSH